MVVKGVLTTIRRMGLRRAIEYIHIRKNEAKLSNVYRSRIGFKFIPYTRHGYLYYNFYHEPLTFKWLSEHAGNYDYFINIGAGYGEYSLFFGYLGLNVYAYEPNPKIYSYFETNIKLNSLEKRIKTFNKAVSQDSVVTLYEPETQTTSSYIDGYGRCEEDNLTKYTVNTSDLRELNGIGGKILWLIDVEGYECNVLRLIQGEYINYSDFIIEVDPSTVKCINQLLRKEYTYLERFGKHSNVLWMMTAPL